MDEANTTPSQVAWTSRRRIRDTQGSRRFERVVLGEHPTRVRGGKVGLMNYFAHAYRCLEDPYFVAGTAVPDWLTVADRPSRVRSRHAKPLVADPDPQTAAVAAGILRHLEDDARFHETRAFAETSLALVVLVRDSLAGEPGFRPSFLGHLLVEVLLDGLLIVEDPVRLDEYYRLLDAVDASRVQATVNRIAQKPTVRLEMMIHAFRRERILGDYLDDGRLMVRLNQVMRRVGLLPLGKSFEAILPEARRRVACRRSELLALEPVEPPATA